MWSALARIFTKNEADSGGGDWETEESMDRGEMRRADLEMQDSYDTSQLRVVLAEVSKCVGRKEGLVPYKKGRLFRAV
ncbi:hypothetical protein QE152_g21545 [Popillia japonica]|uniref:Uncharacterized protein n=1 Tax=Popillia japonica TaxID=7064 RepID=A0AAW1KLR5_POPJA